MWRQPPDRHRAQQFQDFASTANILSASQRSDERQTHAAAYPPTFRTNQCCRSCPPSQARQARRPSPRWASRSRDDEDSRDQYLTDYNILPKDSYVECIKTNIFYHKTVSYKAVLNKQLKIKARKANCIYKPSYNKTNLAKDYAMGVLSPSFVKTEGKRYTFGLEMETISGIIPQYMDSDLNYLSIRDGSLRDANGEEYGHEYVTGVLVGDTGMLQSKKLCNALTSRCMVNRKCG